MLLQHGITAWSYDEECTEKTRVTQLGAKKGEIIARRILELSVLPEGEVKSSSTLSPMVESPPVRLEPTPSTKSEGDSA